MPFDRIFLDELSARNDIVDVVSQYVQLKKSGANYFGLCPFHNEKTGSFSVSPDKQIFHCFGCGAGGGVITFVMKAEGLSFPDAVRYLADRAGIQVPEQGEEERRAARHRDRLYALCRDAARFYYDTLWRPENRAPQQYFIGRGLSRRTMNRFGLGYAPDSFHALMDAMTAKGYTRDELLDAGLVSRSEKGRIYDRFRNRVMFPIIDVRGNVIAFGGRVMDDSKPKYLNSPETPIFHKSRKEMCAMVGVYSLVTAVTICLGYNVFYFELTLPNGSAAQLLDVMDYISNSFLMPFISLLTSILIGWVIGPKWVIDEVEKNGEHFGRAKLYSVMMRYVVPVVMLILFLTSTGFWNLLFRH